MNATRRLAGLAALLTLCLVFGSASSAYAQAAAAAGSQDPGASKQPYTMAEYNSEQACATDKVPASQIKCLDDFVSKYPNSNLLISSLHSSLQCAKESSQSHRFNRQICRARR